MWTCPKCSERIEDQFDSCWKCAGPPDTIGVASQKERLRWFHYVLAGVASYLLPLLVSCLHSAFLLNSYRVQNTLLYQGVRVFRDLNTWLWMGAPALITFLVLLPFLRSR